ETCRPCSFGFAPCVYWRAVVQNSAGTLALYVQRGGFPPLRTAVVLTVCFVCWSYQTTVSVAAQAALLIVT
ncbi:MAG: hypothetical protein ACYDCH_13540, partial [Gaiellaceae bacterium]